MQFLGSQNKILVVRAWYILLHIEPLTVEIFAVYNCFQDKARVNLVNKVVPGSKSKGDNFHTTFSTTKNNCTAVRSGDLTR